MMQKMPSQGHSSYLELLQEKIANDHRGEQVQQVKQVLRARSAIFGFTYSAISLFTFWLTIANLKNSHENCGTD